jgi:hypothetical protein
MPSLASARANEANPNLPHDIVPLNAFNIIPGAAFMVIDEPDPRVWIAEAVDRDASHERVYVWAHDGSNADLESKVLSFRRAFDLDYGTNVALIGLVVNHTDPDDNDWGSN